MVELAAPFELPADSPLPEVLGRAVAAVCGHPSVTLGMKAWTDAANFVQNGADAVVFGPGDLLAGAHQPDESIDVLEIVDAAQILATLFDPNGTLGAE